jgi:translation initiation factor 1
MRPEKAKRIELNPNQGGLAGLNQALGGLNFGALPPGPTLSPDAPQPIKMRKKGRVVLRKETAHRGGRIVIVVDQFPAGTSENTLQDLARGLRKAIGTGGAVKEQTIEMQGDHPDKIRKFLQEAGYDVGGI